MGSPCVLPPPRSSLHHVSRPSGPHRPFHPHCLSPASVPRLPEGSELGPFPSPAGPSTGPAQSGPQGQMRDHCFVRPPGFPMAILPSAHSHPTSPGRLFSHALTQTTRLAATSWPSTSLPCQHLASRPFLRPISLPHPHGPPHGPSLQSTLGIPSAARVLLGRPGSDCQPADPNLLPNWEEHQVP